MPLAEHDPPYLTPLFHLTLLQRAVTALLERAMSDSPLSPAEYAITSAIEESTMGTTALAAQFSVPLTTATEWVNRLVSRGFVERSPDPQDGRRHVLRLTPDGADATLDAREDFGRGYLAFLDELPIDASEASSQLETMTEAARTALRKIEEL